MTNEQIDNIIQATVAKGGAISFLLQQRAAIDGKLKLLGHTGGETPVKKGRPVGSKTKAKPNLAATAQQLADAFDMACEMRQAIDAEGV